MRSLVSWKNKNDKINDTDEISKPNLLGCFNKAEFIESDEVNAKTMRKLKIKW